MISGIGIGLLGTYLITPNEPTFDLNLSIIIGFLIISVFVLIGIGIPGFFHSRLNDKNKNYRRGMGKAALGILLGLVLGGVLSGLSTDLLSYRISSFYIPILTPIICGVIGFNKGIKTYANNVYN